MITFLTKQLPRYGARSGYYSQIVRAARASGTHFSSIEPRRNVAARLAGKLFSLWLGCPPRDQSRAFAELRFRLAWQPQHGVFHILNIDDHLPLLDSWRAAPRNLVGTIHHPPSLWSEEDLHRVRHLALAIVLCRRDLEFFKPHVQRVAFIPHGVDTEFFTPAPAAHGAKQSILLVGNWLRDFATAAATIERLAQAHPDLFFDIVVERERQQDSELGRLVRIAQVRWHHEVDDDSLRDLYQQATVLFLPLLDTSANNALVEALACGTPVVTNRIGGIVDYGSDSIFEAAAECSTEAFTALIERYLREPRRRSEVSERSRAFATAELSWDRIWGQHERAYETLRQA